METPEAFESKRHKMFPPDDFDPSKPRLGRRESEPHSDEINYIYDVITANFPGDRAMWDLHHYFTIDNVEVDIVFDVSYFKDMQLPTRLSSYRAKEFNNRIPTMVINVLSKSTWRADIGEHVDYCRKLKIPIYIVYPSHHIANKYYRPPFLRAYIIQANGEYYIEELHETTIDGENIKPNAIIDVSKYVPFRLGLQKRLITHESNEELYRLIFLDPKKFEVFQTKEQKQEQRAKDAEQRAKDAEQRAEDAEQRAEDAEKKALELENELESLKERIKK